MVLALISQSKTIQTISKKLWLQYKINNARVLFVIINEDKSDGWV